MTHFLLAPRLTEMSLTGCSCCTIIPGMMKYALSSALLGLLFITSSCRHLSSKIELPHSPGEAEEALPVSSLPHDEFSQVSPQRSNRRR